MTTIIALSHFDSGCKQGVGDCCVWESLLGSYEVSIHNVCDNSD